MLGFFHIVYLALIETFGSVLRSAWSSLQLRVWVFALSSISSLFRYRLVSTSFVSFAFPVCLIAFVQFVGYLLLNCQFSVPLYFTLLGFVSHRFASSCFGSLVSPVIEDLK